MQSQTSCTVCGSAQGEPRAAENGFTLLQCGCGAMFLDRTPPEDYIDPAYDPHPADYYAVPAKIRLAFLSAHAPRGVLLEVGCGTGEFLAAAKARAYAVRGIELDAARARAAATRLGAEVELQAVEDSRQPDASCDVVFHCDLLSHLPDPPLALRRMHRMLKPGGVMVFEVGLVGGGPAAWYRSPLRLPHHRWFFDEASLHRLLRDCGFKVLAQQRFGLAPVTGLSRLAGALRVGGGATRPKVYAPDLGRHLELIDQQYVPEADSKGWAASLRGRLYTFVRYRVGALAPRAGPGTAFVAAAAI